jgi:hypothetical protein
LTLRQWRSSARAVDRVEPLATWASASMTSRTSDSTVILARLAASVAASERSKSRGASHDRSSSAAAASMVAVAANALAEATPIAARMTGSSAVRSAVPW